MQRVRLVRFLHFELERPGKFPFLRLPLIHGRQLLMGAGEGGRRRAGRGAALLGGAGETIIELIESHGRRLVTRCGRV